MTKVAKIFTADGLEEAEALVPFDILRRGGVDVKLVSISDSLTIKGSHGVSFQAEEFISAQMSSADLLMLPGGMPGTLNLGACEVLRNVIAKAAADGKIVAAICAAPSVLGQMGLLNGRKATCYPGFESKLTGASCKGERVVKDGNIITGVGPGASFEFGLTLLAELMGKSAADEVKAQMIIK